MGTKPIMVANKRMNDKHRAFAELYVETRNAVQSYLTIYPDSSYDAALRSASRLLRRDDVATWVGEARRKIDEAAFKRLALSKEKLLREMGKLAFYDLRDLYDEAGVLKPISELPDDVAAAIEGVEHDSDGVPIKYKMANKRGSQDQLARFMGLYEKDNQQQQVIINAPAVEKPEDAGT